MIHPRIVKELRSQREWTAVQNHINEVIDSLDRVSDIKAKDDRIIAIEVEARKRAQEKLREILQPFLDYQDPQEPTDLIEEKTEDAGL